MGTRFDTVLPDLEKKKADKVIDNIRKEVLFWESKLTRFSHNSIVGKINSSASKNPVNLDPEIFKIFCICRDYHHLTSGAFNITLLPVSLFWENSPSEPDTEKIQKALEQTGMSFIELDEKNQTIFFSRKEIQIDLGGFGKGYALQKVKDILTNMDIHNALISFGESSVLGIGEPPHGPYWPLGIQHIFEPYTTLYRFQLNNDSLSTSGVSRSNPPRGKKMYGHIINPFTGYPVCGWNTISVRSKDPVEAEILSTALLTGNKNEILKQFPNIEAIEINYGEGKNPEVNKLSFM
jgi:thiamine biosynthesis lipoprotein